MVIKNKVNVAHPQSMEWISNNPYYFKEKDLMIHFNTLESE
jgi:hypothetical protein